MSTATEAAPIVRDVRLDHVGFVDELSKQFAAPLRPLIKATLAGKGAELGEADYFKGKIVSSSSTSIDVARFLRRYEDGGMTRKEFIACITVSVSAARKLMGDVLLDKISTREPADSRLVIERRKEIPLSLSHALAGIAEAIGKP